jgi:hypothetical protein
MRGALGLLTSRWLVDPIVRPTSVAIKATTEELERPTTAASGNCGAVTPAIARSVPPAARES